MNDVPGFTQPTTHVLPDEASLHRAGAERLVQIAAESIAAHGAFYLALSGGETPAGLYRQLATPALAGRIDWSRTHIYFGDERAVPPDHQDSNFHVANELLLSRVPIPGTQVHRIAAEHPPEEAAAAYAQVLAATVPFEGGAPRFDLILLGVGVDGHIASLFPDTAALGAYAVAVAPVFVEKLGAWRITLTFPTLDNARHVMLLVSGAKKADIVRHALFDTPGTQPPLPVQMLFPLGELEWFLDAEAGRCLGRGPA